MDSNKDEIMRVFSNSYGKENASIWFQRWRIFFMACAELFAYKSGNQWFVAHYLFNKKS
jgi:cyclopropane-fatty-acyl-phospholipid synthase